MAKSPHLSLSLLCRICHVLMTWVESYPGDFVKATTLTVLKAFNTLILSATWLLHYAVEILPMSKAIAQMVDEDAGWALPDATDESTVEDLLQHLNRLKMALVPGSPRVAIGLDAEQTENLSAHSKLDSELHPIMKNLGSSPQVSKKVDCTSPSILSQQQQSQLKLMSITTKGSTINDQPPERQNPDNQSSHSKSAGSWSLQIDPNMEHKSLLEFSNQVLALTDETLALQITRLEWDIFAEMKVSDLALSSQKYNEA